METKRLLKYVPILIIMLSCGKETILTHRVFTDNEHQVSLHQVTDSTYRIRSIHQTDTNYWNLDYPVYQFLYADIDQDQKKEILVGVIKKTRYDKNRGKRLFVFKHYKHKIRPQWLGSRLGMPLENFFIDSVGNKKIITSVEYEQDSTFAIGKYQWQRFGFEFIEYTHKHKSKQEIQKLGYEI